MITVGSLFAGIGGLDLGLEQTGGFRTIWFSEVDEYANKVLEKHWPTVPNHGDITKIKWEEAERPDMLAGGFPCQDISIAGKGKGIAEGTRSGLWKEYAKAIRILRPKFALIENVPAIFDRGLDIVLSDLAKMGYDAEWGLISASAVGALHKRERFFCFAYLDGERWIKWGDNWKERHFLSVEEREVKEDKSTRNGWEFGIDKDVETESANPNSKRCKRFFTEKVFRESKNPYWKNIRCIEDLRNRSDIPEPLICGGSDGIPYRMDRIKCLGKTP